MLNRVAIHESVQEFQPKDSIGTSIFDMFAVTQRGEILQANYGTKQLDRELRRWYRSPRAWAMQGALSGLIKKYTSAPYEFSGEGTIEAVIGYSPSGYEITRSMSVVDYFQDIAQEAHFGQGWKPFWSRVLLDYWTQNFGAIVELIGPGEADGPMTGAVTGIAHLDALRCFATGNPVYPIIYYSKITRKMHRMHYSRVYRMVDMPDPDEALYGSGQCALYRAISIVQREMLMGRYVEQSLDDKPKPGIMAVSGMTKGERENAIAAYLREQQSDERPEWGRTLWMHSIDPTAPLKVEAIAFAQTPEAFDFIKYTDLNINALALALGVDKQELWELGGGSLGSGAQSQILSQKSRGKAFGDVLSTGDRMINIAILPEGVTFTFKAKDEEADKAQAALDTQYVGIANSMKTLGIPDKAILNMLADQSETFRKVLVDDKGQIIVADDINRIQANNEVIATDTAQTAPQPDASSNQTPNVPTALTKSISATRADFTTRFKDVVHRALAGRIDQRQAAVYLRSQLRGAGASAFQDGLKQGGITGPLDDDDTFQIQSVFMDQAYYIDNFVQELFTKGLSPEQVDVRAAMWVNKSLDSFYTAGLVAADKNGMYEFAGEDGAESCSTCQRLKGQRHRFKEWYKRDLIPRVSTDKFDCGGWQCQHKLVRTTLPAEGRF